MADVSPWFEESGMAFGRLRVAGAALIAASLLAPTAAGAQAYPIAYYGDGHDHDRPRDRDGYPRQPDVRDRDDPPPRRGDYRQREQCDHGSAGTILGAIAGGLLGNAAVGRHGNRAAGTLAGAGAGALVGRSADRDCD
jgi:hypothetical protein